MRISSCTRHRLECNEQNRQCKIVRRSVLVSLVGCLARRDCNLRPLRQSHPCAYCLHTLHTTCLPCLHTRPEHLYMMPKNMRTGDPRDRGARAGRRCRRDDLIRARLLWQTHADTHASTRACINVRAHTCTVRTCTIACSHARMLACAHACTLPHMRAPPQA